MTSPVNTAIAKPSFWSGTHSGRQIATAEHGSGWVVYIDRVMEANRTFASSEDAVRWLHRKIDDAAFDNRAAMLCARRGRKVARQLAA
jgi:hypothetical protein